MRNRLATGLRPTPLAINIRRPWAFFSLHDGVIESVSYEFAKDRAWGQGAVAPGTEIPQAGGSFSNDIWDGGGTAANGWFNGVTDLHFADALADVPAYAALSPSGGAVLMWAQGNYTMTGGGAGTENSPTAIQLGDAGGAVASNMLRLCVDRGNRRVRVQYKRTGESVGTINGTSTGVLDNDVDFNIAAFVDCRPDVLTVSVFSGGILRASVSIPGDIVIPADTANHYLSIGASYTAGTPAGAGDWEGQLRRVGWIRFPPDAVPTNVSTLVAHLNKHNGIPSSPQLFNAL